MRTVVSMALVFLLMMPLTPAASCAESVASKIAAMPIGSKIELQLKTKKKLRGATGPVSGSGFTLVQPGKPEQQVAFDDVASVTRVTKTSHTTRNVLIGVGIAAAGLGVTAAVLARCAPFGCGKRAF